MASELAFVLLNPYTIRKSRTGGVIARYVGRTDLKLVAARMLAPSCELVDQFASMLRGFQSESLLVTQLLSDYVQREYAPEVTTGRRQRVMLLLFEGEDAIRKIWELTGSVTLKWGSGQTIRDTYGDYVLDDGGEVRYMEPAVLVGHNAREVSSILKLWARYSATDGGILEGARDVPEGEEVQKTLVMLKPDNFRLPSLRPGNIIDILSASGLRIIAIKKVSMSVEQAVEFYGPVKEVLARKFRDIGARRAADALSKEFRFKVPVEAAADLCEKLGPHFAESQFDDIVQYMTGHRPSECPREQWATAGKEACLSMVYDGHKAVETIRSILGATDPSKARPGSVRREFGSNVMMNAAHASDSPDNAVREMRILRIAEDDILPWVQKYYGHVKGGSLSSFHAQRMVEDLVGTLCRRLKSWVTRRRRPAAVPELAAHK